MGGNGRGVMYYTAAFWIIAIIIFLIIICFACGCTDWNGKSCNEKKHNKHFDDQHEDESFRSQYDD